MMQDIETFDPDKKTFRSKLSDLFKKNSQPVAPDYIASEKKPMDAKAWAEIKPTLTESFTKTLELLREKLALYQVDVA
jgi:hypothetical protein